jgi:hypothetical protein
VNGVYYFVTEQFPDCRKLFRMCVNLNPDPRIRTSQRKTPLCQDAIFSGSVRDPDSRIRLKVMQICTDPETQIRIQEIFVGS